MITGIDAELEALKKQTFSTNVIPFIQLVKGKKTSKSNKSLLDDYEALVKSKDDNLFFITVPRNLPLEKRLKSPVEAFFKLVEDDPNYHSTVLNKFAKYKNVIPTLEANFKTYSNGDLEALKDSVTSANSKYCYRIDAKRLNVIWDEVSSLITKNDILVYDMKDYDFSKNSIKKEIESINTLKKEKKFRTVVIKQIYNELTFFKFPDGIIDESTDAFDCVDFDFYTDFKKKSFDYFGDWAGIRNLPIYKGGQSYPSYLTIEMDNFNHHGFKGIEVKTSSYTTELLPKYLKSEHWTKLLTNTHKSDCHGCEKIIAFSKEKDNANSPIKWKTITMSHFIDTMDYKIDNKIV